MYWKYLTYLCRLAHLQLCLTFPSRNQFPASNMMQTLPHCLSRKSNSYSKLSQIPCQIWKLELLTKVAWEVFWRKMIAMSPEYRQFEKLCNLSTKKYLILNKKYNKEILFHEKHFWQEMLSNLCVGKWLLLQLPLSAHCFICCLLAWDSDTTLLRAHRMQRQGSTGQGGSTQLFLLGIGFTLPWQLYCFRKQKGGSEA